MSMLTLPEKAHRQIVDQILKGSINPGEWLREQHFAEKLNMSATPVREAFRQLEREGWVVSLPRCGVQLRTFTKEDIEDIYTIREGLEVAAIDLAIKRGTEEDWKTVKKAVEDYRIECETLFENQKSNHKLCGPDSSDFNFHLSLISATHSQKYYYLSEILNNQILYSAIHIGTKFRLNYQEMMQTSNEHMNIYTALRGKEIRLAEELLRSHLRVAKERLILGLNSD